MVRWLIYFILFGSSFIFEFFLTQAPRYIKVSTSLLFVGIHIKATLRFSLSIFQGFGIGLEESFQNLHYYFNSVQWPSSSTFFKGNQTTILLSLSGSMGHLQLTTKWVNWIIKWSSSHIQSPCALSSLPIINLTFVINVLSSITTMLFKHALFYRR